MEKFEFYKLHLFSIIINSHMRNKNQKSLLKMDGKTALMLAQENNNTAIVELLKSAGVKE